MIKYFPEYKKDHEIDEEVKDRLVKFREYLGYTVTITSGYEETGHATNSEHGEKLNGKPNSKAVDIKSKAPLFWQYACAERAGFENIGIYPAFNGLHLGVRGKDRRRWIGLGIDASQEYVSFNKDNLYKYVCK
jgi:hypothetical protein